MAIKLYLNYEKLSGTMLPKLQHYCIFLFTLSDQYSCRYGSEILGCFSPSKYINNLDRLIKKETDSLVLEKIHTKFCKFILGVRTKSSTIGVRGDLGSFPILFDVLYNMVNYYTAIILIQSKTPI